MSETVRKKEPIEDVLDSLYALRMALKRINVDLASIELKPGISGHNFSTHAKLLPAHSIAMGDRFPRPALIEQHNVMALQAFNVDIKWPAKVQVEHGGRGGFKFVN